MEHLSQAGFDTQVKAVDFPVRIQKNDYYQSIRERFISDSRGFSDQEIESGIDELLTLFVDQVDLNFNDRLYAVIGSKK